MSDALPYAEDLIGPEPKTLPYAEDLIGPGPDAPPSGFAGRLFGSGADFDSLYDAMAPFGRVLRAFGQGAATAWEGGENLGYSDDVNDALKRAGVYQDTANGQGGLLRAYNEALIRPAVSATFGVVGAFGRGISAAVAGAQAAVAQAGEEVGAPQLGRDIAALPEAFPLFGEETGGLRGVPTLERGQLLGQELASGMNRALSPLEVDHAADLGLIGPDARSSWQDTSYGGPVTATQDSITPTVTARVSGLQDAAKQDAASGSPAPPDAPLPSTDIHEAARAVAPETFAVYDPLAREAEALRGQIAEAQLELRRQAEAQAPHQAEIADLRERLEDATPRLAKKYQARLDVLEPERDAFLADDFTMGALTRDTAEIQDLRRRLMETDYQMRDLAPDVTAAYREAAKQFPETQGLSREQPAVPATEDQLAERADDIKRSASGVPTPPGSQGSERLAPAAEAAPEAPVQVTPEGRAVRATVTAETATPASTAAPEAAAAGSPVTGTQAAGAPLDIRAAERAKLVAAGVPLDQARAAAEIVAAGYETRAARFAGAKGTAEDLYRAEAPDVVRGRNVARVPEFAQPKGRELEQPIKRVLPADNLRQGVTAAARALDEKVSVPGAMYREDIGDITFDYGKPGNPRRSYAGGFGFSHIVARRGLEGVDGEAFVRQRVPEVLAYGRLDRIYGPPTGRRVDIVLGGDQVSLSLMRHGERESWVVTAFRRRSGSGEREGVNPSSPYAAAPSGIQATKGAEPRLSITDSGEKGEPGDLDRHGGDAGRPTTMPEAAAAPPEVPNAGNGGRTLEQEGGAGQDDVNLHLSPAREIEQREAGLTPAVRVSGKVYEGTDHANASGKVPLAGNEDAASEYGFVDSQGRFLDRRRAYDYAETNDLLRPESRGRGYSELTSDDLSPGGRQFGQTARGKIAINEGRNVITLFKDANASTFIHETGHDWLEKLLSDAKDPRAPAQLVTDSKTVRAWLGAAPDAEITRGQHEKFARGFERYLMEGVAPSRALDRVFAQFRDWLTKIYQTVARLRAPITPDIRAVFDRMLATDPQPAVIAPERSPAGREMSGSAGPLTPYMRPGKEPLRLTGFLRRKTVQFPGTAQETTIPGGVRDPGGDIAAIIGGPKAVPGLINNATGSSIHDALIRAWENGYFPEHTEHWGLEDNDLLRKIEEDYGGNPQYSMHDQEAVDAYHAALEHNAEVDRLAAEHGIDPTGMSREQFFDAVAEKASVQEQARAIKDAETAHEEVYDEYSEEVKAWLEDHDIPWDSDDFYGLTEPRTLEELEAERGQEAAARSAGQGAAGDEQSGASGAYPGAGEESGGLRGRGAGPAGRAEAEDAAGSAAAGTAGRPEPAGTQPAGGPHAAVEEPSGLVDKAGNIRLDNLNSDDDVKQVLRDLAAQHDDFMGARGGVISDVQRAAMAEGLGLDFDSFQDGKPAGVSPSVWAEAVQKLTFQASDEAARLGRLAGESGTPQDLAAYLQARQRLLMIADHFSYLTAEAGRTLRVFDKAGMQFTGDLVARMERDTGKTLYQLQQEARAVGAMETTAQRARMVRDASEPSRWQRIRAGIISYFINNLISGPLTHGAYAVGNQVTALFKAVPLTVAEASIDRVRELVAGAPLADRVHFGEVGAQVYGMMHGAWAGFSPGWKAFKSGIANMDGAERLEQGGQGGLALGEMVQRPAVIGPALEAAGVPSAIAGPVGYGLETPSRLVSAIHTVFYSMNYEREIARRAFRAAANEGLTGDAFNTKVAQLTQDPSLGMVQAAHDEAMRSVLMQSPKYGSGQQQAVALVNRYLPLKLAMPFMQIGLNILDEGLIQSTPLGLASQGVRDNLFGRNGEVARTQQYARIMVGSGLAAGAMAAAAQEILTGAGPTDPRERALKEATGWQPYSIRIGDTYIPYRKYLGPLGPLVGGAASVYEVGHLMEQGQVTKAVGSAVLGFAHVVADESWMQGAASLVDAVTHWDTDGEKYLRNLALNFLPFSVGASQVAREVDDSQREVHSWTAALRNKLPGLSEGLMPQRDWTGTPIGSHTMLSPSVFKNDPTMAAMEAASFYPAKLQRQVRGVPLTDQQYDDFARVAGGLAKMRMDALVRMPGFSALPEGLRNKQMEQTLASSRKVAEDWLMLQPENANILRQAAAAKQAQVQGKIPEDVRAIRRGN